GHAIAGRLSEEAAARELLAVGASAGQCLLGRLPAGRDLVERSLELGAVRAGLLGGGLGMPALGVVGAQLVADELPARLERLALEPGMQLGRLGLSLERSQPRAGLALDV